jgi:hypothetical protein
MSTYLSKYLNKCAFMFAFDEHITDGTTFEGNINKIALGEINEIIQELIDGKIYDNSGISKKILEDFLQLDIYNIDEIPTLDDFIDGFLSESNGYLMCGWNGHTILIFFEKQPDSNYVIGIINAGEGIEKGHTDELSNGIIILSNVSYEYLQNSFTLYYKHYSKNITESYYNDSGLYSLIYHIVIKQFCLNEKLIR